MKYLNSLDSLLLIPLILSNLINAISSSNSSTSSNINSIFDIQQINTPSLNYQSFGNQIGFFGLFDSVAILKYSGQQDLWLSQQDDTDSDSDSGSDSTTFIYAYENNLDLYSSSNSSNSSSSSSSSSNVLKITQLSDVVQLVYPIYDNSFILVGDFGHYSQINDSNTQISSPCIFNISTNQFLLIDPDHEINGTISSIYFDQASDLIYFGGNFEFNNSFGSLIYDLNDNQLKNLPFNGFNQNSQINSIQKIKDNSILFAGDFYSLGLQNLLFTNQSYFLSYNSTLHNSINSTNNSQISIDIDQVVSFKYANITTDSTDQSIADSSIICPNDNSNGWLMGEAIQEGAWVADLPFTVYPTKIRIYNSRYNDNAGVKTFRLITSPSNSIMNLTYIDPETNQLATCNAWCPLLQQTNIQSLYENLDELNPNNITNLTSTSYLNDNSVDSTLSWGPEYQDFAFVNYIQVNYLNLHVYDYYGSRGGLAGIEMFTREILTYANNTLNEPNCDTQYSGRSYSEVSGSGWEQSITGTFASNNIDLSGSDPTSIGVTFYPNISYSGNYSLSLYTPGCQADGTCDTRGMVSVKLYDAQNNLLNDFISYQNNEFEKIEPLYSGYLNITNPYDEDYDEDDISRPRVELTFSNYILGLSSERVTMVADKVSVEILGLDTVYNSTHSNSTNSTTIDLELDNNYYIYLNGLFEYDTNNFTAFSDDYDSFNFSSEDFENTFVGNSSINKLMVENFNKNASINSIIYLNNSLYIGGDFRSLANGRYFHSVNIGDYDDSKNELEISNNNIDSSFNNIIKGMFTGYDDSLIVVGTFTDFNSSDLSSLDQNDDNRYSPNHVAALIQNDWYTFSSGVTDSIYHFSKTIFNDNEYFIFSTQNFDIFHLWDNTNKYWVSRNELTLNVTSSAVTNDEQISVIFGNIQLNGISTPNGVFIDQNESLRTFGFDFDDSREINIVHDTLWFNESLTVISGDFETTEGISNLLFIQAINGSIVYTGLDDFINWQNSSISTINKDKTGRYLYIGTNGDAELLEREISSNIFIYDLFYDNFTVPSPVISDSGESKINALVYSERQNILIVGGEFDKASSLDCPNLCFYDLDSNRWNDLSTTTITDGIVYSMNMTSNTKLFITGDLTVENVQGYLASFDFSTSLIQINHDLNDPATTSSSITKKRSNILEQTFDESDSSDIAIPTSVKQFILVDGGDSTNDRVLVLGDHYVSAYNTSEWTRLDLLTDELEHHESNFTKFRLVNVESEESNYYFEDNKVLVVTGSIEFTEYGTFSVAFFNGTNWFPYLRTFSADDTDPIVYSILLNKAISSDNKDTSAISHENLAKGWIVFISLALAIGTIMLLSLLAVLIAMFKRRKNDYDPNLQTRIEEQEMVQTVPPAELFDHMNEFKQHRQ
ncbi:Rax2p ASCRUDRAFT_71449 [Ascoidea rubescens DSM 1968]|uniref:Uncharacterized protein n=1 Tax=Ascoidea rubescens DSM 1968 TaxID=1344418 RepID=A0A1D2VEE3_9ASCO|nr:hypothetical protein ASCRUDRAFT_71449 [Ascoidea rubescens DSM 1968]ODV59979.1 hypothetical protein ASCRUDRAFT_71449 [Ascoidea rubescens DSM 1968]